MKIAKRIMILVIILTAGLFTACNTDPFIGSTGTALGAVDVDGDGNFNDGTAIDADGDGIADGVDSSGDGAIDLPWSDDFKIDPADDGGSTAPDTTDPDTTAPGEVVNLKATKMIDDGWGSEFVFTWDDPSDSDLEYVIITYDTINKDGDFSYIPKGKLTTTCWSQKPNTISSYTFQTKDKTGNLSEGVTVELFVPTARNLDITYVDNNDNLNTLLNTPAYYILEEDIVLSNDGNPNWTPVGNFKGILWGNGHSISNVTINTSGNYVGFFSSLMNPDSNAVIIRDLVLDNIKVETDNGYAGALVGFVNSSARIINCGAKGTVTSTTRAGGLLGFADSNPEIRKCYADVNVTGAGDVGGFAGSINTATDCYAVGTVDKPLSSGSVGGFAGAVTGSVKQCYAAGEVTGASGNKYGFTGSIGSSGSLTNCYYNSGLASVSDGAAGNIDLTDVTGFTGFDFTSDNPVWSINSSVNNGMPYLTSLKP